MKVLIGCLLCISGLFAGSIRLYNDSPYKLRAVIRGADGTYLGEMVILPQHYNTWSNDYPSFSGGQNYSLNPNQTQTPYTVQWYCLEGGVYGINTNVPTGAAAMAQASSGPRICQPPPKQQGQSPYGPSENDEQLHNQNEAQSGSSGH